MSDDLAAHLEAASRSSREMSDVVLREMGWTYDPKHLAAAWAKPSGERFPFSPHRPDPSRSVDDGLALAGDDWADILERAFYALYYSTDRKLSRLPLFICAALVRARAKQQEDSER